jgi:putative flippase GtrA
MKRFLKYNVVGALGLAVKFLALVALVEAAGLGYLAATAIAVEMVVLHNFLWHLRWTWRDRSAGLSAREVRGCLLRFHLGTGAVAMVANLGVMRLLVETGGVHYFTANLAATAFAGLANFTLSEWVVFRRTCRT